MDDDNRFELSRRSALAGIGAIGVASAGAGLGTSAYFSDEESFENNTIAAGELDLKVDWEEHYYDGMGEAASLVETADDESEADYVLPAITPLNGDIQLGNGDYVNGAPVNTLHATDDAKPIALNFVGDADKDAFWDATSIEAFPDPDNNGIQGDQSEGSEFEYDACAMGADLDEDLDPRGDGLRTENEDTIGTVDDGEEEIYPLINLHDVKPGDFGELTLSFHLCDNDGYVWLTGELLENAENGVTEPEAEDPDEDDGDGVADPEAGDEMSGELADNVLTRIWYDDDCDNQVDEEMGELDIMLAVDTSGSIRGDEQDQMRDGVNEFIDELPTGGNVQVGTLTFGDNEVANLQGLDTPDNISVSLPNFGGNTPLPAAIDIADQAVRDTSIGARPGAQKTVVVFTDGGPNYENTNYSAGGYEAPRGTDDPGYSDDDATDGYDSGSVDSSVDEDEMAETALVADTVKGNTTRIATIFIGEDDSTDAMTQDAIDTYGTLPDYLANEIASPGFSFTVDFADLQSLAIQLQESIVVGEEVFFLGTLAEAVGYLESGNGIPLDGDLQTAFNELEGDDGDENRECFPASSTHCVGFEWWLPLNHANQIQGDSVQFDLGFYTEQCRHNDGTGPAPEATSETNATNTTG
jgi:predicted ribosomally synthesized peptide with SipW-like signal peptide